MRPGYALAEAARAARLLTLDPRAGATRIRRAMGVLRAAILFRRCTCGELVNATGHVRVIADGRIRIGDRVQLSGGMIATELIARPGAELEVGERTFFNYGVSVESHRRIVIGARCMFGSMSRISDEEGRGVAGGPIVIGDDVWVAHGAIVRAGVTIGEGSVVAAGAVVESDIPPYSLASGHPAACIALRRGAA